MLDKWYYYDLVEPYDEVLDELIEEISQLD
jgi:hypothetical protein